MTKSKTLDELLAGLGHEPSPEELDRFYQEIRVADPFYIACDHSDVDAVYRSSLATIYRLGQASVPIALGLSMHVYMLAAISTFPLSPTSPLASFRKNILAHIKGNGLLLANTSSAGLTTSSVVEGELRTSRESDTVTVNGQRSFMSLATRADLLVLVALLEGEHRIFLVPLKDNKAIRFGASPVSATMDLSDTRSVILEGLRVQPIQEFGQDPSVPKRDVLAYERVWFQSLIPAVYLGGARRAIDELVRQSRRRTAGNGAPLCEAESFQIELGRLRIQLEAALALLERAGQGIGAFTRGEQSLQHTYDLSVVAKHQAVQQAEAIVGQVRRLIGSASMAPGSIVERISREVMFGGFHPMSASDAERRFAMRCLEEVA